jgi:sigma-70-like protein
MIVRILAGERELFHELIRPYERGLYVAAYSIVQHEADAEDIAQEAVIKAYEDLIKEPQRNTIAGARLGVHHGSFLPATIYQALRPANEANDYGRRSPPAAHLQRLKNSFMKSRSSYKTNDINGV